MPQTIIEHFVENVLKGLSWKQYLVYLDDLLLASNSFENHRKRFERELKLVPKKCCFFKKEVRRFGHIVSDKGITVEDTNIKTIND